jgi:hypothetical protein
MRLRITEPPSGRIDGIQLDRFESGLVYDVGTSIANYLMAEGWAVPVDDDVAPVVPLISYPDGHALGPHLKVR